MRPPSMRLGGDGSRRMIVIADTLLPQPDSPTSPTVLPAGTSNDTSSTTGTRAAVGGEGDGEVLDGEEGRGGYAFA